MPAPPRVPAVAGEPGFAEAFERWLYGFGGRFAAILLEPVLRAYTDAGGSLPLLYDAERGLVASSPFLLDAPGEPVPDAVLLDAVRPLESGASFLLGTTAHARAERLVADHVLDLRTWTTSRFWPRVPFEAGPVEPLVERIASLVEAALRAAAATGEAKLGLTAGGDSRFFLACARAFARELRFFTSPFPDTVGRTDARVAVELAGRFGLDHVLLPWVPGTRRDVERFLYRTGLLTGEHRGRRSGPTYAALGASGVYVSGVGAELARSRGLRVGDGPSTAITSADLLERFGHPSHPELRRRADAWLASLPAGMPATDVLSLFYLETRVDGWGGPLTTAFPEACDWTLYPFAQRGVVDAIMRLPWEYRAEGAMRVDAIAARWPELLDLPVNHPPPLVALRGRAAKAGELGRAAARKALAGVGLAF